MEGFIHLWLQDRSEDVGPDLGTPRPPGPPLLYVGQLGGPAGPGRGKEWIGGCRRCRFTSGMHIGRVLF